MTRRTPRPVAVLAALLAASCRGVPFPDVEPSYDEAARAALVADLLPPAVPATMVQRWVVTDGHGELFFTLYVQVRPPGSMAIVALSDLGGTLASGTWTDGSVAIDRDSRAFPARIAKSVLLVLAPLFLPGPPAEYELVRFADGTPAVRRAHGDAQVLRWRDGRQRDVRIVAGQGGRTRCTVTVTAWGTSAGVRHPASLRSEDPAEGLRATLDVVRFEPVAGEDAPR